MQEIITAIKVYSRGVQQSVPDMSGDYVRALGVKMGYYVVVSPHLLEL